MTESKICPCIHRPILACERFQVDGIVLVLGGHHDAEEVVHARLREGKVEGEHDNQEEGEDAAEEGCDELHHPTPRRGERALERVKRAEDGLRLLRAAEEVGGLRYTLKGARELDGIEILRYLGDESSGVGKDGWEEEVDKREHGAQDEDVHQ